MVGMAEWWNGAEWQKEWQNGRMAGMDTYVLGGNGGNGGMAGMAGMAEWRNGGNGGWNGGIYRFLLYLISNKAII